MQKPVRVRFAPSPTGALHIGGLRTALFNYLFAKQHQGAMILRIEDTDRTRFVPGAEDYIDEALQWIGIEITEGVKKGGAFAPYRQSERKQLYHHYVQQLLDAGNAYYAFDTTEELEKQRTTSSEFIYGPITRRQLKNSLTLSETDVQKLIASGKFVIRLKVPEDETVVVHDLIRGEVSFNSSLLDDKVLMKSDGMPTYHLANVVDDYRMQISHVIRGEEWLPSAPIHVLLYRYLGWEKECPHFAHLPLLLKPDGKGKLSKRDADRMGFPIFPLTWKDPQTGEVSVGYREKGFLPEALLNFLALLGWNPGTEKEILSVDELASLFSLERIQKGGARFDSKKAEYFNQQYLQLKSEETLGEMLLQQLSLKSIDCSKEKAQRIAAALRERIVFPNDLLIQSEPFFSAPISYDIKAIEKKWNVEIKKIVITFASMLTTLSPFQSVTIRETLDKVCADVHFPTGKVMPILRIAITGASSGADLMTLMEIIEREETCRRLQLFVEKNPTP